MSRASPKKYSGELRDAQCASFFRPAEIMGVGRRTVFEWWEKYRNSGLAGLSAKFASGRPTALSDR